MESIAGIVAVLFIVVFVYSFFQSFDLLSIVLDFTIPEKVVIQTRWVLGIIALLSTLTYIVLSLKD